MEYMVYFVSDGIREGVEVVKANSREEARAHYKRYFNVNDEDIKAIPRIDPQKMRKTYSKSEVVAQEG